MGYIKWHGIKPVQYNWMLPVNQVSQEELREGITDALNETFYSVDDVLADEKE